MRKFAQNRFVVIVLQLISVNEYEETKNQDNKNQSVTESIS